MRPPYEANGYARYATLKRWPGLATKYGYDPKEETVLETRAKIGPRLVVVHNGLYRFDRVTGANRSAYNPHTKPMRLLAYRRDLSPSNNWNQVQAPYIPEIAQVCERCDSTDLKNGDPKDCRSPECSANRHPDKE